MNLDNLNISELMESITSSMPNIGSSTISIPEDMYTSLQAQAVRELALYLDSLNHQHLDNAQSILTILEKVSK